MEELPQKKRNRLGESEEEIQVTQIWDLDKVIHKERKLGRRGRLRGGGAEYAHRKKK